MLGDAQWHFSPGNPTFTASPSFIAEAICRGCSTLCSKIRGLFVLALLAPCTHFTRTEVRKWCLKKKPREFRIICWSQQPTACNVRAWLLVGAFQWWILVHFKSTYNCAMAQNSNFHKFWGTRLLCIVWLYPDSAEGTSQHRHSGFCLTWIQGATDLVSSGLW